MKKWLSVILGIMLFAFSLVGCSTNSSGNGKNIEGTVEEILQQIYEGLEDSSQLPFLTNIPLFEDIGEGNDGRKISYYIGAKGIPFIEGIASEAAIGGAYSVCLLRMENNADIEKAKKDIKDNVDPNKWICYTADTVIVDNIGDLVLLIMTNNQTAPGLGNAIYDSFKKLAK